MRQLSKGETFKYLSNFPVILSTYHEADKRALNLTTVHLADKCESVSPPSSSHGYKCRLQIGQMLFVKLTHYHGLGGSDLYSLDKQKHSNI